VLLRGTGMALHRSVLLQYPWQARSIVEDSEYSLQLIERGVRIAFLNDARVVSDFPERHDQLNIQRGRWIRGWARVAASQVPRLIGRGLRERRLALLDAALTILVASRPLILAELLASFLLSLIGWLVWNAQWAAVAMAVCATIAACYAAYATVGVISLGLSVRRMGLLLQFPLGMMRYIVVAAKSLFRCDAAVWRRTPRIE